MYLEFYSELLLCLGLSILAVFVIVFVVTADVTMTLLVALMVSITDFFLLGFMHYWGLTLN